MPAQPGRTPRPDQPHLHLVETPPAGDERLRAVHGFRQQVTALTGSPEKMNSEAQFARSPMLKSIVMDFLKIDDPTFERYKVAIAKEVTQILTEGVIPETKLLWDWCSRHKKMYAELMEKVRRAFQVYQKRLALEARSVTKDTLGPIEVDGFLSSQKAQHILDHFLGAEVDHATRKAIMREFFNYFLEGDKSAPTLWKLANEHPELRVGDLTKAMKAAFNEYRGEEKRAA